MSPKAETVPTNPVSEGKITDAAKMNNAESAKIKAEAMGEEQVARPLPPSRRLSPVSIISSPFKSPSKIASYRRALLTWVKVNGGVLLCAIASHGSSKLTREVTGSALASAAAATLTLYVLVFAATAINLRGRARAMRWTAPSAPIALASILSHPVGSCLERLLHERHLAPVSVVDGTGAAVAAAAANGAPLALIVAAAVWWLWLAARLLLFEVAFDGLFYVAHRAVHAHPLAYRLIHKLHHRHTHDVRLLSSLQMNSLDVIVTHTLPVLGALWLVPIVSGLEFCVIKTYLLFQELYGHAGVEHKGRNFGPAPFLIQLLDLELHACDHQRHHIQASVNFSKRFNLWDRVGGTWSAQPATPIQSSGGVKEE